MDEISRKLFFSTKKREHNCGTSKWKRVKKTEQCSSANETVNDVPNESFAAVGALTASEISEIDEKLDEIETNSIQLLSGKLSIPSSEKGSAHGRKRKKQKTKPVKVSQALEIRKQYKIFVWGTDIPDPCCSFSDFKIPMDMKSAILEKLQSLGFNSPTPVQMQAISVMLKKREVLVSAPTGSGKTLAFGISLILHAQSRNKMSTDNDIGAVVLEPTRELAKQTFNELVRLSEGFGVRIQFLPKLKKQGKKGSALHVTKIDILVTTPNRLVYELLSEDPRICLESVDWLIIDESDKLFETGNQGFRAQLAKIYGACESKGIRRALFSATFSYEVESWCKKSLDNPIMICVGARNSTVETVTQELKFVGSEQGKLIALRDLFHKGLTPPVLIFVQSKDRAIQLLQELQAENIKNVQAIHSLMGQHEREKAIESFREAETWVLISTELMARGLDFKAVNVVVNFDFPTSAISYIHRIGRTGRAGRSGQAITFFTENDRNMLPTIATVMKQSGCQVPEFMMQLPKTSRKIKKHLQTRAPKRARIRQTVRPRNNTKYRRIKPRKE